MTNEATTPDAERLVRNLKNVAYAHGQTDSVEYGSDKKYRLAQEKSEEAAGALRAHISALEEQIGCMTKHQAGADEKLCQLEAENKRLLSYEIAWLIECRNPISPTYLGRADGDEGGVIGWTTDHTKALRFARKVDAALYAEDIGWNDVQFIEHAWVNTKAALAQTGDKG